MKTRRISEIFRNFFIFISDSCYFILAVHPAFPFPEANIIAVDYDPGASEVNQLNRIKLMLATANKNLEKSEN